MPDFTAAHATCYFFFFFTEFFKSVTLHQAVQFVFHH